jgi:hypothetical protein
LKVLSGDEGLSAGQEMFCTSNFQNKVIYFNLSTGAPEARSFEITLFELLNILITAHRLKNGVQENIT